MKCTHLKAAVLTVSMLSGFCLAEPVAKIASIEGTASVLRAGGDKWINCRPGMPVSVGDELFCRTESFMEIRYNMGIVLRLDENSKIVIASASGDSVITKTALGNVWVNMKKLSGKGKTFDLSSPTAVASIRGTAYQMSTGTDSSTDVSVYEGKVAVGLTDNVKSSLPAPSRPAAGEPTEVPGPSEVPGPFEVSLEAWKTIVAGQKISVRKDGKFAQSQIDMKKAGQNSFVKKNQDLDTKLAGEK